MVTDILVFSLGEAWFTCRESSVDRCDDHGGLPSSISCGHPNLAAAAVKRPHPWRQIM